ncbi:cytochrome P460 family protein [Candidatus Kuenenia sp.]|uniref:cytochrome P460 family protein n=1 Tax=Candidatus Kuenenia sp. TaxID=2499824 RepID=UPI00321FBCC9
MNKSKTIGFLIVIIAVVCFTLQKRGTAEIPGINEKINAQRLWEYMTKENPYQCYPAWPGKEGIYESTMPPGDILRLYINDLALDTVVKKKGIFPNGSLLIKEIYTEENKVSLLTVMYKEKGFDPQGNDWYWVKYGHDGEVKLEGRVGLCIECHVGVADNDYVFTGSIKK